MTSTPNSVSGALAASALLLMGCGKKLDGPDPELAAQLADPALVCIEQITTTVTLNGSGLAPTVFDALTDGEQVVLPQIDLQRTTDLQGNSVDDAPIRVPDDGGLVRWIDSTRMEFDVDPSLGLAPGIYSITVTNPDGSQATMHDALGGVEEPVIDEIVPEALCLAQGAQSFELHGSGFLVVDGERPTVNVGGELFTPTAMDGCSDLLVPLQGVQVCSVAVVELAQDELDVGAYDVILTNPQPADCSTSDPVVLEITAPPEITSVDPQRICTGGGTLVIGGNNFNERASVLIGGEPAFNVNFVSENELQALFGLLGLDPGTYSVTVEQDGCSDTLDAAITVVEGIIVFFVDPPVVFNGIDTRVTIYVSGLASAPTKVALLDENGVEIDLTDSISFVKSGQVQAVVPADLAVGSYSVLVEDADTDCESILPGGLTVTDETILALESITPPFGHTGADTAVELRAAAEPPAGEVNFVRTPRAYLNPNGAEGDVATQLESVAFVDETRLTGIVPAGLPVGTYDVIVVNPTGEVGILLEEFTVTLEPPPEIDEISPGQLEVSQTPQAATILGRNFRDPTVTFTCRLPDGTIVSPEVVRTGFTGETIGITVDTGDLLNRTVCVVRVENDDGTFVDFSSVTITNPAAAQNAVLFAPGPELETPRRAPAAAAGRASRAARFVYTIGGDDGGVANTHATVEASPVDLFGDLAGWFTLPIELPAGRSFARAVTIADRFIYLVGGNEGSGPTASALRAKILDPAERAPTPEIDLTLADVGLDPGVWYYRLSAVVADNAAQDPGGGEILASDPLVIQLPEIQNRKVQVHLTWNPVPDAVTYRLYRTPAPDLASGDELLLAEIAAPTASFTDDGTVTPAGDAPLPLGSTGRWHALGALGDAREAHGLTVAPDPVLPGLFHIYAVSGAGAGEVDLDSVERLTVAVADGAQTPAVAWVPATSLPAGTGRHHLQALTAHGGNASKVGDDVFLYALSGTRGVTTAAAAHAIQVQEGGLLGEVVDPAWTSVEQVNPARSGYGAALANNQVLVLGGLAANNETNGSKANICSSTGDVGCAQNPDPPHLGTWSSLGQIDMAARALMGTAVQSGMLYLIGGTNTSGAVLSSTDQSPLGGQQ